MSALLAILACHAMGVALVLARGGRDPLIAGALGFPLGLAATAGLVFAFAALGLPLSLGWFGAAWLSLLALAAFAARRDLRCLWPGPALVAAGLAAAALVGARFDVSVLAVSSHETLLRAGVLAAGGDAEVAGLSTCLHAAFFLVAPVHTGALALALAGSALLALAAMLVRCAARPSALPIGLATGALATWFPLLRSLLTVGSPAAGAVLLLAGAGLWILGELDGDRRRLPLALGALAALALDGAAPAVAAALVLAPTSPLIPGGPTWRVRATRLVPGVRVAIAAALAGAWLAASGDGARGAIVAGPAGLFALVLLATGRRPAALSVESRADHREARVDVDAVLLAWLVAALIAALLEWGLLLVQARDQMSSPLQGIRLLALGLGNLLPYVLAASVVLAASEVALHVVSGRRPWPRATVAAVAALLSTPYALWLARYTFSGPQARDTPNRSLLVALVAGLVAVGFAAGVAFHLVRRTRSGWRPAVLAGLVAAAGALLVASRVQLVNEYGPLHGFVAVWIVLLAALAGREIVALFRAVAPRRVRALALAATAWAVIAGVLLARTHGDAWLLWGETGVSRYLTARWRFLTPVPDRPADFPRVVARPDLESEQTAALRAARAAAPPPNIVIFTVDGLRRDRVGAYGYTRRPVTPNIDRFARRGVRFDNAFTSYPATQVFNSTLLLGRYLVFASPQQPPGYRAEAITTLLDRRGYHILVKNWFEPAGNSTFDPAAFKIDTFVPPGGHGRRLEEPLDRAMARLERHLDQARDRSEPVLVWMHLLGAHMKATRFVADPRFDFGDQPMDRYESAVAGMDSWLGAIEERMQSRLDPSRPTVWIISADHGVNPTTRSRDLHNPIVRVPLIVVAPGAEAWVDDRPVDVSLDVAATVVDLAGIAPPADYDGVSLVPLLAGLPADAMRDRLILMNLAEWSGAVHGRYKYMRLGGAASLFDLVADPGETHNLIGERYDLAYWLADAADRELARRIRNAERARGASP